MVLINKDHSKNFNHCGLNGTVTIVTSIAPRDIDVQRKAVESWLRLGFEVVSMNVIEEIEILREYFDNIQFIEASRSAKDKYGKPYIYFDDILAYFQQTESRICGIVNSDIHLFGDNFKSIVCQEAIDSLLYGHRVEIKSLDNLNGPMYEEGFDYFFFDRKIISCYPKEDFFLGQPWWDYWAVLHPILNGYPVKKLLDPVAYHIRHSINWNQENWLQLAQRFGYYFSNYTSLTNETIPGYIGLLLGVIRERSNYQIFTKPQDHECDVGIIFDNKGVSPNESPTYKSIMAQTYHNYNVYIGDILSLKLDQIKEEFICFIEEGYVLNDRFLEANMAFLDKEDIIVCGLTPKRNDGSIFHKNIFPIHNFDNLIHLNYRNKSCNIYRVKSFIKNGEFNEDLLFNKKLKVVGLGLVNTSINNLFQGEHNEKRSKKIYIYGAGGHTKDLLKNIDLSGYQISGIVDKNPALNGQELCGYKIFNLNSLDENDYDYILISSNSYEKQIFDELSQKVDRDKLIRIYYNNEP